MMNETSHVCRLALAVLPALPAVASGQGADAVAAVLRHEPARNALERTTRRRRAAVGAGHGDRGDLGARAHSRDPRQIKTRRDFSRRAPTFATRWSRAESAPMPSPTHVLSGRSQRGDSA